MANPTIAAGRLTPGAKYPEPENPALEELREGIGTAECGSGMSNIQGGNTLLRHSAVQFRYAASNSNWIRLTASPREAGFNEPCSI